MSPTGNGTPDWASLSHAYGPAVDTPQHLSRLRSDDPHDRKRAWGELIGSANHQGEVYPVTPWIVDPLIDLATDPAYPERLYATAHVTLIVEDLVYHLDDPDALKPPTWSSDDQSARDQIVAECRRVAGGRASEVKTLVQDEDPEIRRWALRLLGVLEREGAADTTQFQHSLADPDPLTRAIALWQTKITSPDPSQPSKHALRIAGGGERNALDYYVAHVVLLAGRHHPEESAREILRLHDALDSDYEKAGLLHVADSPMVFAVVLSGVGSGLELESLAERVSS